MNEMRKRRRRVDKGVKGLGLRDFIQSLADGAAPTIQNQSSSLLSQPLMCSGDGIVQHKTAHAESQLTSHSIDQPNEDYWMGDGAKAEINPVSDFAVAAIDDLQADTSIGDGEKAEVPSETEIVDGMSDLSSDDDEDRLPEHDDDQLHLPKHAPDDLKQPTRLPSGMTVEEAGTILEGITTYDHPPPKVRLV